MECDGASAVERRRFNRDVDRTRRFLDVRHRAFRRQHVSPCAELRLQGQFEHDRGAGSRAEYAIYDAGVGVRALRPVDVTDRSENPVRCGFSVLVPLQDNGRSLVARLRCDADVCECGCTDRFGGKIGRRDDGHIQLAQAQRFDGEIQRGKAGCRLGRYRETHALEIMRIGHAIGGHVRHGTENGCCLKRWCDAGLRSGKLRRVRRESCQRCQAFSQQPPRRIRRTAHGGEDAHPVGRYGRDRLQGFFHHIDNGELLWFRLKQIRRRRPRGLRIRTHLAARRRRFQRLVHDPTRDSICAPVGTSKQACSADHNALF